MVVADHLATCEATFRQTIESAYTAQAAKIPTPQIDQRGQMAASAIDGIMSGPLDDDEDGYANETLKKQINALAAGRDELRDLIIGQKEAPALLHPTMAKRYHAEVNALVRALNDEKSRH